MLGSGGLYSRVAFFRKKAKLSTYQLAVRVGLYTQAGFLTARTISRLEKAENTRDEAKLVYTEESSTENADSTGINVLVALKIFEVFKEEGVVTNFNEVFSVHNFDSKQNVSDFQLIDKKKQTPYKKKTVNDEQ